MDDRLESFMGIRDTELGKDTHTHTHTSGHLSAGMLYTLRVSFRGGKGVGARKRFAPPPRKMGSESKLTNSN